ncbi:MAG: hypothetical protein H7039_17200, partial [Bryobacteraceae bacterium]|nr:hypothetical protein [Bryobacteraceae bacterium]
GLSDEALYTKAFATEAVSSAMRQIHRHESRLRRSGEKARIELEQIQTLRNEVEDSLMDAYGVKTVEQLHEAIRKNPHFVPARKSQQNEPTNPPLALSQPLAKRAA